MPVLWASAHLVFPGAALAIILLAAWHGMRHRATAAARTLGYGVSLIAAVISATSGGLHNWVALPWLASLVVAALLLSTAESFALGVAIALAASGMAIWNELVGPLPVYWLPPSPPAEITFAITLLATLAVAYVAVHLSIEQRVAQRVAAADAQRAQAGLEQERDRLRDMFGALPVATALYDADTRLRYANPAYLAILGKELDLCQGRALAELWPRRAALTLRPHLEQAAAGRSARHGMEFNGSDSVLREFDVLTAPCSPDLGGQADALVLMLDRTDSLRLERELAEREAIYGAVVNHAPIGILTQIDGLITYANPAALRLLETNWSGRTVGRPFHEFIVDTDREAVRERLAALEQAPGFAEFRHYRLVTLDGQTRDVELAAVSVARAGRMLVELFCVDLTERRLADEKIRQLNETLELRVTERTAELEAFTTSVSHDLRAPARQVMSAADIMLRKLDQPQSNIRPMLSALRSTAERMNRTIDALLELSRLGRAGITPSVWPLGPMIDDIRAEMASELANREVTWHIAPLPPVYGDPRLLRLVMVNLINNALKFSRKEPVSVIEIWAEETAGMTAINVRDNGAGFEVAQTDKLFQMFSRLHSSVDFEGTGVGLAHCRRIIERHGGRISATGRPGLGATIRLELPPEELAA